MPRAFAQETHFPARIYGDVKGGGWGFESRSINHRMIPKWPRDVDDNGKPFQLHDSGSVDTCSDAAMPLSRPLGTAILSATTSHRQPTSPAPLFLPLLRNVRAHQIRCVLDAAAQPARKAVCALRLERPPGWFGRLVAGGSEDKAAYECAWDVETKHPSARNKPEALQFRYDAGIYCMHGTRYSIFHCG